MTPKFSSLLGSTIEGLSTSLQPPVSTTSPSAGTNWISHLLKSIAILTNISTSLLVESPWWIKRTGSTGDKSAITFLLISHRPLRLCFCVISSSWRSLSFSLECLTQRKESGRLPSGREFEQMQDLKGNMQCVNRRQPPCLMPTHFANVVGTGSISLPLTPSWSGQTISANTSSPLVCAAQSSSHLSETLCPPHQPTDTICC